MPPTNSPTVQIPRLPGCRLLSGFLPCPQVRSRFSFAPSLYPPLGCSLPECLSSDCHSPKAAYLRTAVERRSRVGLRSFHGRPAALASLLDRRALEHQFPHQIRISLSLSLRAACLARATHPPRQVRDSLQAKNKAEPTAFLDLRLHLWAIRGVQSLRSWRFHILTRMQHWDDSWRPRRRRMRSALCRPPARSRARSYRCWTVSRHWMSTSLPPSPAASRAITPAARPLSPCRPVRYCIRLLSRTSAGSDGASSPQRGDLRHCDVLL